MLDIPADCSGPGSMDFCSMHVCRLVAGLMAMLAQASFNPSSAQTEDPYIAVATAFPGVSNYVRRVEVEAIFDSNPSKCGLILTNAKLIRAYETCASIIVELKRDDLTAFTNSFGKVLVSAPFVNHLMGTNNGGCRLSLKNGRYISVNEPCSKVHDAVALEEAAQPNNESSGPE